MPASTACTEATAVAAGLGRESDLLCGAAALWALAGAQARQTWRCQGDLGGTQCGDHRIWPQPAYQHTCTDRRNDTDSIRQQRKQGLPPASAQCAGACQCWYVSKKKATSW